MPRKPIIRPDKIRTAQEQEQATTKLNLIRKSFQAFYDSSTQLRVNTKLAFDMVIGGEKQWLIDDKAKLDKEQRPVLAFNVCQPIVNFLAGYEEQRVQDPRFFPRGTEDESLGRVATSLAKYALDIGQGHEQQHRQFRKGVTGGMAAMHVCMNYDLVDDLVEGEVDFPIMPENSFYWDPFARRYDRNDAKYEGEMPWFTMDEAKQKWPQHASVLTPSWVDNWTQQAPQLTGVPTQLLRARIFYDKDTGRIRVLRHWYRQSVTVTLLVDHSKPSGEGVERMESGAAAEKKLRAIRDTEGQMAAANYSIQEADSQTALIGPPGPDGQPQVQTFITPDEAQQSLDLIKTQIGMAATSMCEIVTRDTTALRVAHVTAWELLDDGPSPYGTDYRFPYAIFIPYQETDDFDAIKGVVYDIMDPQRELNWHYATLLDKLVRGPKGGFWVPKGEHVDIQKLKQEISKAGFIGEYVSKPPEPIQVPAYIQEEVQLIQMCIQGIMQISGINAELLGQTTQKTVSGRAIQSRQAGGLVGVGSLMMNWRQTKRYAFELLIRRIQQSYSEAKMDRILGQEDRIVKELGLFGVQNAIMPQPQLLALFKRIKDIDFDVVADFQEATVTARQAIFTQMMQLMAAGMPIPPELLLESSEAPYKDVIKAKLKTQGMGPPNPDLAKAISAGQGSASMPTGVNRE